MSETTSPEEKTQPNQRLKKILEAAQKAEEEAEKTQPPVRPLPPVSAPVEGVTEGQRHPTGLPDQTGGWFGELSGQELPAAENDGGADGADPSLSPPPAFFEPEQIPDRIEEVDLSATTVTPVAFRNSLPAYSAGEPASPSSPTRPEDQSPMPGDWYPPGAAEKTSRQLRLRRISSSQQPPAAPPPKKTTGGKKTAGCFFQVIVAFLFLAVLVLVAIGTFLVYQYFTIRASLPSVDELRAQASQFETARIYDRDGNVIYEIIDPNAGRRTYVKLDKISKYLLAATIATEDKDFYINPGFDIWAIGRAMWQNYTSGEVVSGASTITQQLARNLLLSPDEAYEQTVRRKTREIVLAAEITRNYSKDEILEIYLNENNYGQLAYGIEAASETYFGVPASELTLGQSAFLAGLPQSPGIYDIFTNRDVTLARQKQVLLLMYELSQKEGCVNLGPERERLCITPEEVATASQEIEQYNFRQAQNDLKYPHWVNYIRMLLEGMYDPQTIYRSGFRIYTTLDPEMQELGQRIVRDTVAGLKDKNASNGALVAIQPSTGEILAMVGSSDFNNEAISGQVNMAVAPRQPGSSIKPLTYAAAFEKGWTPATVIWDVPSEFPPSGDPNDTRDPYKPVNYDGRFHGPVTVRLALANSFNIPAVKTLDFIGIYDNPQTSEKDGFIAFAQRLGITTLNRADYGLSLTLGGGDVSLLELTGAYAVFANRGIRIPPVAITRIEDRTGQVIYQYTPPSGEQVMRPEHAYFISSILSDNDARSWMFGANSVLNLPFQVAAKTGTTNDFRDNWTLGFTPDLAVGVWVGNADYTPMVNTTGLTGAAPIWSQFFQQAIAMLPNAPSPFIRPAGVVDRIVCRWSGAEPSQWCPDQISEIFAFDQLPPDKSQDLWQRVRLDSWTGLLASPACDEYTEEKIVANVTDKWARKWLTETGDGEKWAKDHNLDVPVQFMPERECRANDPKVLLAFANLTDGQVVTEPQLDVFIVARGDNFKKFSVQYGFGEKPKEWKYLARDVDREFKDAEKLLTWDLKDFPSGKVTLRLTATSTKGTTAKKQITIVLNLPTPTPTNTPTPTSTATQTLTPTATETATPSATP